MIKIALLPTASQYTRQMIEQLKGLGKLTIEDFAPIVDYRGSPLPAAPQLTQQLPVNQPHRKTGVAQARRDARKRRNRK